MNTLATPARTRFPRFAELPDSYAGLCALHLLRPIHNAAEARAAAAVIESLAGFPLNRDQTDYLEAVAHFMDEYDRAHTAALPAADGKAVLRHLMDEHGMSAADLSRLLGGSRNLGAMILRRERNLTLPHVRTLAAHFKVSPEVFL